MNKTIFLHIGSGKTGTTSIQHMLNENKKKLLENGYLYHPTNPDLKKPNHHNLVTTPFDNKMWQRDKKKYLELKNIFLNSQASTMIISTERIMGVPLYYIKHIKNLFKGMDIKIIAYVRNQVDSMPSYFLQRQKDLESDYKEDLETFFHHHKHHWGNEVEKVLNNWLPVFGKENIFIRVYDREILTEGDICTDCAKTLGIRPFIVKTQYSANESLLPELSSLVTTIDNTLPVLKKSKHGYRQQVIIKTLLDISRLYKAKRVHYDKNFDLLAHKIHKHFKDIGTKKLYRIFIAIENSREILKQNQKVNLLSRTLELEIIEYYKEINEKFAKTFLNTRESNYFLKHYNNTPKI